MDNTRFIILKTSVPEVSMPIEGFLQKDDIIHTDYGTFKVTQVEHILSGPFNAFIRTNYICEV